LRYNDSIGYIIAYFEWCTGNHSKNGMFLQMSHAKHMCSVACLAINKSNFTAKE